MRLERVVGEEKRERNGGFDWADLGDGAWLTVGGIVGLPVSRT